MINDRDLARHLQTPAPEHGETKVTDHHGRPVGVVRRIQPCHHIFKLDSRSLTWLCACGARRHDQNTPHTAPTPPHNAPAKGVGASNHCT